MEKIQNISGLKEWKIKWLNVSEMEDIGSRHHSSIYFQRQTGGGRGLHKRLPIF